MKNLKMSILAMAALLAMQGLFMGLALAADNPQQDLLEAEKAFEQAGQEFDSAGKAFGNLSQRGDRMSWSDYAAGKADPQASQPETRLNPAMQGTPETGYSGTYVDPANGDIVTSVIAPRPPANSYQSEPIVIQPYVGGWGEGSYGGGWSGNPQWPVAPGSPGYPSAPPPPSPGMQPPFYPTPNPGLMPPMGLPQGVQPGYRPLRPNRPPHVGNGNWNPRPPLPGFRPPQTGNGWNPGGFPPPGMGPGMPPPPMGPGMVPPPPGMGPGMVPPRPGMAPGMVPPRPGMIPGPRPGGLPPRGAN